MNIVRRVLTGFVTAACFLAGNVQASPAYPERPVNLIVPFAAGGPTDSIARILARSFEKLGGQPFVVENKAGAGSIIGTAYVADGAPDGYRLLWGSSSAMVIAPHLYKETRYDPFKSFAPIGMVASTPYVLLVRSDAPYNTYEELVDFAKKNPGTLNYGSPGEGTSLHLTIERMAIESGFEAVHIPFRGGSPAMAALLAGDVDFVIDVPSAAVPQVKGGKLRALAVTSPERIASLPETPTLQEKGLAGFESSAWFAMYAPAGTPEAVIKRLEEMLGTSLKDQEILATLQGAGFIPTNATGSELKQRMERESAIWKELIKQKNISLK